MWNHQRSNWDEVVNGSTVEKSVDPETERPPPDGEPGADENEENSSDKEEEKESGKEKEPGEEDKEPGEEQKEPEEGVELESRRNDEHAEETGETQAARQHQTESHAEVSNYLGICRTFKSWWIITQFNCITV